MGAGLSRKFGEETDGAKYPANFAFTLGGKQMCSSSFKELGVDGSGIGKILCICTGESRLKLANGEIFSTGHNPTEIFVPLYHLDKAGYEIEIATPGAKPVTIEAWALPACKLGGYADQVESIQAKLKAQLEAPTDVSEIADLDAYVGLFLPGGHGPMINMHEQKAVGDLLTAAHKKGLPTASICHGPNALRATTLSEGGEFAYKGYKMCVFPDKADSMPMLRYLPGPMVQKAEAELKTLGAVISNKAMDDMVVTDRELTTGSSQRAAQKLGAAFVEALKKGPVTAA
eukprot:gene999-3830_t